MSKGILIADDNVSVRTAVRLMLETHAGWSVCAEAADGHQAIMKAQQSAPDLIVLDMSMPVMNGLDAAGELRTILPTVPIVMYTSFEGPQLTQCALSAGVNAVVSKSAPDQLFTTVRDLLEPTA